MFIAKALLLFLACLELGCLLHIQAATSPSPSPAPSRGPRPLRSPRPIASPTPQRSPAPKPVAPVVSSPSPKPAPKPSPMPKPSPSPTPKSAPSSPSPRNGNPLCPVDGCDSATCPTVSNGLSLDGFVGTLLQGLGSIPPSCFNTAIQLGNNCIVDLQASQGCCSSGCTNLLKTLVGASSGAPDPCFAPLGNLVCNTLSATGVNYSPVLFGLLARCSGATYGCDSLPTSG